MHLLVRETRSIDEEAPAEEPGQDTAPLLALSFSDADLGALAHAWSPDRPALRLRALARLRHPMSVDLWLEQVAAGARCILVRLLGGLDYWRYGAEELAALCRARGIALALLPGDKASDQRLLALSTVAHADWILLNDAMRFGGPANTALALDLAAHLAGLAPRPGAVPRPVPLRGPFSLPSRFSLPGPSAPGPAAAIILYRSHLLSADTAPITALAHALRARGLDPRAIFVDSLKSPCTATWTAIALHTLRPAVVMNATAFAARPSSIGPSSISPGSVAIDRPSPLEAAGAPILQLVLAGTAKADWDASPRGLSATDLAMQVVLPEADGRLLTAAISFKAAQSPDPALQYARILHAPDADGIAGAADRAAGWVRLATTPRAQRRLAVCLSDYPGIGGQQGHAVGLDTFRSLEAALALLHREGFAIDPLPEAALVDALCHAEPRPFLALDAYRTLLAALPAPIQAALHAAWGDPAQDPSLRGGTFTLRHLRAGNALLALQPDRGGVAGHKAGNHDPGRKAGYHDPDTPPRHGFVAFHLWLRHGFDAHALVQLGAHGSLEWLPGKAAALGPECFPRALLGGLPVAYPFIANNPGEAAAAKRRLGAVTIGHLTPPLTGAAAPTRVEALLEEYAAADGLDRRRLRLLRAAVLEEADGAGLLRESGIAPGIPDDEALARLDAFLCDVKDLQLRDGLHVFGCSDQDPASAASERAGLLAALDGRFVPPGPAGAASRGRPDVLPTGRNLVTVDPRGLPTQTAFTLAAKAAEALLRRHVQENGEWPRALMLDLWASATMRTGGEDIALAFHLLGARPTWDAGSFRVSGFEILPLAVLDRPRIDVTLRISGAFRDGFPALVTLFDALVRAVAARDEAPDWNPLAGAAAPARVFGPPPGSYGAGDGTAAAWLAASAASFGAGREGATDPAALHARIAAADAFVHVQDHGETDLLESPEVASHEGGFAAAAAALGRAPPLYHLDTARPEAPRPRLVAEEVARVVRGRAANPAWIGGQMRHGFRGAAEIARPLAALQRFAETLPDRFDAQFDLLHAATLGTAPVRAFLGAENPAALADMERRFAAIRAAGLWHPRRNDLTA